MIEIVNLECPGCGYPITMSTRTCPQCGRAIVISSFSKMSGDWGSLAGKLARFNDMKLRNDPDNNELHITKAFCHMKLKLYDKAAAAFETASDNDPLNDELYYYRAVCLTNGKRPFVLNLSAIKSITQLIDAALEIEEKGIYHFFKAYIMYDFYEKKGYNTPSDPRNEMALASSCGIAGGDITEFWNMLYDTDSNNIPAFLKV